MKNHAEYLTDEQIAKEVTRLAKNLDVEYKEQSKERNAYFTDQEEVEAIFARMDIISAMYKARKEAGITQEELAQKMGTKQTYIAALERGKKNITLSTLTRYANACGKKVAITLV